ncbi:rhodanese-like domain-containing protein [Alphaproteobacteria bacterium]|jgi:rhodanese-related sulfurtransferase|nr:rhodanese-like domain-containing protein [Alphaproteobacteria bacterium]
MPQEITMGVKQMVESAKAEIENLSVGVVRAAMTDPKTVIVDIRDIRELQREGRIPGSLHVPRGMLEFWIDPKSPYHKPIFAEDKNFIFHCASGWRSALAAKVAQEMGLKPVAHIESGFAGWSKAGAPVEEYKK